MIRNALRDCGLQGLGNGQAGAPRIHPASTGQRWQRSAAHATAPGDSATPAGQYHTDWGKAKPGHYVETRGARAGEVMRLERDPAPPAAQAREGAGSAPSEYPIRLGGPAQFLVKLLETWQLGQEAAMTLLGLEESQRPYLHDLLNGRATPAGRDIKDRIAHLAVIRMTLAGLFADETVENEWLREPHRPLEDREPMSLMLEGSMENLLLVREYVDTAAGL